MTGGNGSTLAQPESFEFSAENIERAQKFIAKYPEGRQQSAVMPLLDLAQRQNDDWLPTAAIEYIADYLDMPSMRVFEVASFYTMYNLKPVGKTRIQVCTTTPCWLRGSDEVVATCKRKLGIGIGETTADGEFSLTEVECLGACVNAPVVQVNEDYYEDVDGQHAEELIDALQKGERPTPGPMNGRQMSAPEGQRTTLLKEQGGT